MINISKKVFISLNLYKDSKLLWIHYGLLKAGRNLRYNFQSPILLVAKEIKMVAAWSAASCLI